MTSDEPRIIRPQRGPQSDYLASRADIAIYGGAAGGGKTWSLLLEPLRGIYDPAYRAVILRRVMPSITSGGGLLDESTKLYPLLGGTLKRSPRLSWTWESGARLEFSQIQYDASVQAYKGAQYTLIGFDELTEFTEHQFWFLVSRARSADSRFRPRIRATTNPDASSWVRRLIDWWIGDDGYPIPERSGVLRWVMRDGDTLVWSDTPQDGYLSMTFIPARLDDNKALTEADPTYEARLRLLSRVEQLKLRLGNWDATAREGLFKHHRISRVALPRHRLPEGLRWLRYWDLANTEPHERNKDPDWTAGVKLSLHTDADGYQHLYIMDVAHVRLSGAAKHDMMRRCAQADGFEVEIWIEQEGGSSGSEVAHDYRTRHLAGYRVVMDKPSGDKATRALRWAALAEAGHVYIVADEHGRWPVWADALLAEIESFPWGKKDQVDAISGGYSACVTPTFAIA